MVVKQSLTSKQTTQEGVHVVHTNILYIFYIKRDFFKYVRVVALEKRMMSLAYLGGDWRTIFFASNFKF